jgi:hypothetical protein
MGDFDELPQSTGRSTFRDNVIHEVTEQEENQDEKQDVIEEKTESDEASYYDEESDNNE